MHDDAFDDDFRPEEPRPPSKSHRKRAAQAMPQRGAHQRQLQFIGKLMRRIDDPEAIRAALATVRVPRR